MNANNELNCNEYCHMVVTMWKYKRYCNIIPIIDIQRKIAI